MNNCKKKEQQQDLSKEDLADIEHDFMVEMFGEEDAKYFEAAGIDDIGNK